MVTVGLAQKHALAREGIASMLGQQAELRFTGAVADPTALAVMMACDPPDVLLLDINLGRVGGLDLIRGIRESHPTCRVIILSTFTDEALLLDAIAMGASGYLSMDCSRTLLVHGISVVAAGGVLVPRELLAHALWRLPSAASQEERDAVASLTPDEQQVLAGLATGERNRHMASRLHLSEATLKKHVQGILAKLGVTNRTGAVAVAVRVGPAAVPLAVDGRSEVGARRVPLQSVPGVGTAPIVDRPLVRHPASTGS